MPKRTMRNKIKLALESNNKLMSPNEIYEYIKENIDADAKIITVYLTVRSMHKENLISKVGDKYKLKNRGISLL